MKTIILNDKSHIVDQRICGFDIHQKPSSNVELFGVNHEGSMLFVQFKNGNSYLYSDVSNEKLNEAVQADSIGSFISKQIVRKHESLKMNERLVWAEPEIINNSSI